MHPISMKRVHPFFASVLRTSHIELTIPGMDALEKNKSKHVVAPAINWLIATLHDAVMLGYSTEKA